MLFVPEIYTKWIFKRWWRSHGLWSQTHHSRNAGENNKFRGHFILGEIKYASTPGLFDFQFDPCFPIKLQCLKFKVRLDDKILWQLWTQWCNIKTISRNAFNRQQRFAPKSGFVPSQFLVRKNCLGLLSSSQLVKNSNMQISMNWVEMRWLSITVNSPNTSLGHVCISSWAQPIAVKLVNFLNGIEKIPKMQPDSRLVSSSNSKFVAQNYHQNTKLEVLSRLGL